MLSACRLASIIASLLSCIRCCSSHIRCCAVVTLYSTWCSVHYHRCWISTKLPPQYPNSCASTAFMHDRKQPYYSPDIVPLSTVMCILVNSNRMSVSAVLLPSLLHSTPFYPIQITFIVHIHVRFGASLGRVDMFKMETYGTMHDHQINLTFMHGRYLCSSKYSDCFRKLP